MVQLITKWVHSQQALPTLISLLILLLIVDQTAGQQNQETKTMSGVSTGAARAYTSRRTVGLVEANAPMVFEDITAQTALARFRHHSGSAEKNYIIEAPSGGVAIFDYDGDGRPDIYLLNGSTIPAMQGKEKPPKAALYRNLGNWLFEDV